LKFWIEKQIKSLFWTDVKPPAGGLCDHRAYEALFMFIDVNSGNIHQESGTKESQHLKTNLASVKENCPDNYASEIWGESIVVTILIDRNGRE